MACDSTTRELIKIAQLKRSLKLSNKVTDDNKRRLVKQIVDVIARETVTDILQKEADTLSEIKACQRTIVEKPLEIASSYTSAVP